MSWIRGSRGLNFSIFLISFLLLALRNLDPVLRPALFAEDGTWLANGLSNGWIQALTQSRPDYPVFLQAALLFIASTLSTLISGNPLLLAPYFIALLSWAFFALLASLIFTSFHKISGVNKLWSSIATLFFIALPVGNTANEIYGRNLQIGFLVPVASFLLTFIRVSVEKQTLQRKIITDTLLMIFMATNPVTSILFLTHLAGEYIRKRRQTTSPQQGLWDRGLFVVIGFAIASLLYVSGTIGRGTGLPGNFEIAGLFPAITRAWLYPYIFPVFTSLNFWISITLMVSWLALVGFAIFKSDGLPRKLLVSLSFLLVLWTAISIVGRPALTHFAREFESSFPDRYYLGLNTISILITILSLWVFLRKRKNFIGQSLGAITLAGIVAIYSFVSLELHPRMQIAQPGNYISNQICKGVVQNGIQEISIYPDPWKIQVPSKFSMNCDNK
jgi:hypothetical protein